MKLVKTASGHKIKMSRQEWTDMGKKAGWLSKKAMDPYDAWKTTPPDDGEVCPECGEEMEFDGDCHWTCEDCGEETTDFSQLDEGDIWAIREGI